MNDLQPSAPEGAGRAQPAGPGATPRRAIAAVAGGMLLVGVIGAALLMRGDSDPVGEGSATPSPTEVASESPAGSPTATAAPSAEPVSPSPTADRTTIPADWTAAATFSEPGHRYLLGDLIEWSGGGLIAVGTRWEQEHRAVFGPPPPRSGVVWRSTDGTDWTDVTPNGTFDDVELGHLFETADGTLVIVGTTWNELDTVPLAWESSDAETWQPATFDGIGLGSHILRAESGARGWLALVSTGGDTEVMWSSNGRSWTPTSGLSGRATHLGAGAEGFVVAGFDDADAAQPATIAASSDGITWFDASVPDADFFQIAPSGGDWVAIGSSFGDAFRSDVWSSANGLDWTMIGEVPLAQGDPQGACGEGPGRLHSVGDFLVLGTTLIGMCSEGGVAGAGASYASADGAAWTKLPFGDQATAGGAAAIGDRFVIGTDAATGQADTPGVTFWISVP